MVLYSSPGSKILFIISCIGLVWYSALWAIGILGCWTARKRYRTRYGSTNSIPGVSILRPLKGLDMNLYENLESTFTQDYPNFEILLSVADERDQALPVVRALIARYPHVQAKVIIGEEVVGVNPKVNNLVRSYRVAAHDILWVLDSNVMVSPGTLARSVDALESPLESGKHVGLVHHVPFGCSHGSGVGSRIEEAFLNTNHAKMYLAINSVAIESCVVGKSNLYRRSDIERVNGSLLPSNEINAIQPRQHGIEAFGIYLAEDNMIAAALWHELGLRHDLSCDVVRNIIGNMSISDYVWRRVRWIRVRKHMVLGATIAEPFTEAVVLALIGGASINHITGVPLWCILLLHFIVLLQLDLDVRRSLAGQPLPKGTRLKFMLAWAAREIIALPIFLLAIFGNDVSWRGKKYQVLRHGRVKQSAIMT